tara:strand:- start:170 stop:604 length:435 start_codon:yes stop_codon:yes gene_type:complete
MNVKSVPFTEERNQRIISNIERLYKIKWSAIVSKSRKVELIEARRLYCALLRNVFGLSLQVIGKMVNTHHASVIHSIKMHDNYSEIYSGYDDNYNEIKETLVDKESLAYFLDELKHLEKMKNKIQIQIDSLVKKKANNILTKNN